jgi:cell division protein FtsL
MDNKNLINGSTALAPKQKPYYPNKNDEQEKQRKEQAKKQKALQQEKLQAKAKVIKSIAVAFIVGVVLVTRYSVVYNLQKDLTVIQNGIHNLDMENENLKVMLIKSSNFEQVETMAKSKLNMVTPDKNNVIHLETTKDYFAKSTDDNSKNTQEDFIAKIKNMLF